MQEVAIDEMDDVESTVRLCGIDVREGLLDRKPVQGGGREKASGVSSSRGSE